MVSSKLNIWHENEVNEFPDVMHIKELLSAQKQKIKDAKYIADLIEHDLVCEIKSKLTKYDFIDFRTAQEILTSKDRKRGPLNLIQNTIREDFFNGDKSFKVTHIISCGYEAYAWSVQLEDGVRKCRVQVPIKKNMNISNYTYAAEGKFQFCVCEVGGYDSCWKVIYQDYDPKKVAKIICEYYGLAWEIDDSE